MSAHRNEDQLSTPHGKQSLVRVQTVKARLKIKSEAMQAYADWLYDRLAQSTRVGFVLHATNNQKKFLVAEWEASHRRLLMFKESTEEIQFTFRKLQKNLDLLEQKLQDLEAVKSLSKNEVPDADEFIALLADLRDSCALAPKIENGIDINGSQCIDLSARVDCQPQPALPSPNGDTLPRSFDQSFNEESGMDADVSVETIPEPVVEQDLLTSEPVPEDLTVRGLPDVENERDEFNETESFEVEGASVLDASQFEPLDLSN